MNEKTPAILEQKGWSTSIARAKRRIKENDEALEFWRRKAHMLRMIVAGDYSAIDSNATPQRDPSETPAAQHREKSLEDILVLDFEESCSNLMYQGVRTLVAQAGARFPTFEFDDMESEQAQFHQGILAARLGARPIGCGMMHHKRIALLDYIISGVGFTWDSVRMGRIVTLPVDSLDVTWPALDLSTPNDWTWIGLKQSKPLYQWIEVFGEKGMREVIEVYSRGQNDDVYLERVVSMQYFWDIEGEMGSMHVYPTEGNFAPIWSSPNPHTSFHNGFPEPFLPLTEDYHLRLPSVRQPVGIAEMMLPAQMAVRRSEQRFAKAMSKLRPFWDIEVGAYDTKTLEQFEDGIDYAFMPREKGYAVATLVQGGGMTKEELAYKQTNQEALIGMGGINPYAAGNTQPNVKYASETNAIREAGGLMVSMLATDHADSYRRSGFKALSNAKLYDQAYLRIMYRDIPLIFSPEDPIGQYIDPVTIPNVSEDSMAFVDKSRATAEAIQILSAASPFLKLFPQSTAMLYEDFLRAAQKKNIKQHMMVSAPLGNDGSPEATDTSGVTEQGQ